MSTRRYLLDTTVLIDLSKRFEPTTSGVRALIEARHEIALCAVTVAEFYSGLGITERTYWDIFISKLPYWDISRSAATRAGVDRADFRRRGRTFTTTDSLLAALARERNAILVTSNERDFPMDDLQVLNIRVDSLVDESVDDDQPSGK